MTESNLDRVFRSALFVDFDNIYIRLSEQDPSIANTFASQPLQWIAWLEGSLPLYGISDPNAARRILLRRCYLNPKSFGTYRPYFIRSAFETVDCPALTVAGKTSADVHIVLDVLELLDHKVFYDEFIIMSADADFTPVLLKLRKCDRRTAVLAVGRSSPAYRAASDLVIDQDDFIEEALVPAEAVAIPSKPSPPVVIAFTEESKAECSRIVQDHVSKAPAPVVMATIASHIRRTCPNISDDWQGFGSFKNFLSNLDLGSLQTSTVVPGYVYDPDKHTPPSGMESLEKDEEFSEKHPNLFELAKRIHQLTDTPLLLPEHYTQVFEVIASEINERGYHITSVSRNARDRCKDLKIPVGRQHLNFVLRGIAFKGHRFGAQLEEPKILAEKLLENTVDLCENAQLLLDEEEINLVKGWIMHGFVDTEEQ